MRSESGSLRTRFLDCLRYSDDAPPLSSEGIITLIRQHLACKRSRRLPALVITAAYQAVEVKFSGRALALKFHHAVDGQTGAPSNIEVWLVNDERGLVYDLKSSRVTRNDLDDALKKIARSDPQIDNYLFVTTDVIDDEIRDYAAGMYELTGGTEVAVLDCIGFLRHFLHLFHRSRTAFLNGYQELVLNEPESAVGAALKEAFLALRQAAEAGD